VHPKANNNNNDNNNVTYIAQICQGRKCATACQCNIVSHSDRTHPLLPVMETTLMFVCLLCKRQLANTNVLISRYRLSANGRQ